ncbi:7-cyano-7-deazaguanine synthase QueC [Roseomonas indoligenes]|uniref:7-cyano-7-deazaguanine synthase n=1 Tax=Roseomonas indoligenes TaxID=2820811 RepID=A0A940N464_9PROT|nr:7-cyano-7-deazaguanine synthase QueC [Pararoseomonas indoligenes]
MDSSAALVLFSGGQDSTTCLGWALSRFGRVETVGFEYGQRHKVEMAVRPAVLAAVRAAFPDWTERLGDDHVVDLSALGQVSDTALTRDVEIRMQEGGLPTTFVPGRNILFLTFAAALACRRNIKHLVAGVCETDYSGYPDCRDDTIKATQLALNLGMENRFVIHTPLMWIDKAATWALAQELGGGAFVDIVREQTHTCYLGDREHRHDWGCGCGGCPACELRADGWRRFRAGSMAGISLRVGRSRHGF